LGVGGADSKESNKAGDGKTAHDDVLQLKHPSTHGFPNVLQAFAAPHLADAIGDAVQMGPQCGRDAARSHDPNLGFCPAKSQLYRFIGKCCGDP
jgi:hypothetical protein